MVVKGSRRGHLGHLRGANGALRAIQGNLTQSVCWQDVGNQRRGESTASDALPLGRARSCSVATAATHLTTAAHHGPIVEGAAMSPGILELAICDLLSDERLVVGSAHGTVD